MSNMVLRDASASKKLGAYPQWLIDPKNVVSTATKIPISDKNISEMDSLDCC